MIAETNLLGTYLRDRRAKLDPAAFGIPTIRRRTPGLRREEVAQRANVSATWYTWLEQGRGGTPSSEVLDRIAGALELTAAEREHLFMLAQHRPPEVEYRPFETITPQLQRVLDSLELTPAYVKTPFWDVVAWNHAASAVLTDYSALPPEERNILRAFFCLPFSRERLLDWEQNARAMVAAFRAEAARAGAADRVAGFVSRLSDESPEFARIWQEYDVHAQGEGAKRFRHPVVGVIALEYSSFDVAGRPDLGLTLFTPATAEDRERIRTLVAAARAMPLLGG